MTEQDTKYRMARHPSSVIEVESDGEQAVELSSSERPRCDGVIEVLSDASQSDDELEIVSESAATFAEGNDDDIQITGHNRMQPPEFQYPGAPMELLPVTDQPDDTSSSSFSSPIPQPSQRRQFGAMRRTMRMRQQQQQQQQQRRPRQGTAARQLLSDLLELTRFSVPFSFFDLNQEQQRALYEYFHEQDSPNEISSAIMARLEREDELALDRKIENEKIFNRKVLQKKRKEAKEKDNMHTTNITPEENLLCELCGVQLGEGIPETFKANPNLADNFEKYATEFEINAPWFCVRQILEVDRTLSKRVFAAKCGHVFCGRCIKNIGNRPPGRRTKKQDKEVSIDNPLISAPRKCPAEGCSHQFLRRKRAFTELFL